MPSVLVPNGNRPCHAREVAMLSSFFAIREHPCIILRITKREGKTIEEKKFRARCGNKEAAGSQDYLYPQKGVPWGSEPVDEKDAFTA